MTDPESASYSLICSSKAAGDDDGLKSIVSFDTFDGSFFTVKGRADFERCKEHPKFRIHAHGEYIRWTDKEKGTFETLNGGVPTMVALRLPQARAWTVSKMKLNSTTTKGRACQIDFDDAVNPSPTDIKSVEIIIPSKPQDDNSMVDPVDYGKLLGLALDVAKNVVDTNIAFRRFAEAMKDTLGSDAPAMI